MKKLIHQFKQYLAHINGAEFNAKNFIYGRGILPEPGTPLYSPRREYRLSMGMA